MKAALDVADAEGFETVSMRRVAGRLGVGAMTLYSYVDSKDDLLRHVFDEVMGELIVPEPLPEDWREAFSAISRRTRDVWLEHPWLAQLVGARTESARGRCGMSSSRSRPSRRSAWTSPSRSGCWASSTTT